MKREYWKYMVTIIPYLKRHKVLGSASMTLMACGALAALAQPWPLAFVVDSVLGKNRPPSAVTDLVGRSKNDLIVFAVVISIGIVVVNSVVGVIDSYVNTRLEQRMALEFRSDLFAHCVRLSQAFHDYRNLGDFIYRINFEAHHVGAVTVAIPALIQSVLTLVAMFLITFAISPTLALLALTVVPFVYLSIGIYGKHIEPRLIKVRGLEGLSLSIVHEVFSRLKVVVGFNREIHEGDRFWRQGDDAVRARIGVTVAQTIFNLAVGLITAIGTGLILGVGAHYVLDKVLTLGELLVVISYVGSIYQPLQTISSTMGDFQNHLVALRFAGEIMSLVPDVQDQPDAHELRDVRGAVAMEGLCFDYPSREATLTDINFTAEPGQVVAIVGPTGAGKSTLVNLLMRFYDPTAGRVLVDGRDIRTVTQRSLRDQIGLVLQEPLLLDATVADNIRYGSLDATGDEIIEAAKAANAHEFVMRLPRGYDTPLGEGGARLSGGERQRLCIARAFVKAAPILILDEPTSSIDSQTESVILDALDRLMVGRTTFMIAHRLSTIRHADQILVIDEGRMVEHGTHDELMEQDGLYRSLAQMQSGERRTHVAQPEPPRPAIEVATVVPDPEPVWRGAFATRPKVVVLGMMTKIPVPGVVWQTMHYLVGLERLGFDPYYVEAHARTPSMFVHSAHEDVADTAADFIASMMRRFGLANRWAFHALHDGDRCYGMTHAELNQLYRSAALIINLHGGTRPLEEHAAAGTLIYIETDPVTLQVELEENCEDTIRMLEPHAAFFTFAENLGHPSCLLPVSDRFNFRPTRQPVLLDRWATTGEDGSGGSDRFTTVGNWRQSQREVHFRDDTYTWSKDLEFTKILDLPRRTGQSFELALASYTDADRLLLEEHGWLVRPASDLSDDIDHYRGYIEGSRGELTVAKDQNVRLRSGWFSDRSATYLSAGRPVVTQETGFSNVLPTGRGLFGFDSLDEAAAAVEAINADYAGHRSAAHEIAREFFAHDRVLKPILEHVGLSPASRRHGLLPEEASLPDDLVLTPTAKRPLCLDPRTVETVLARPHPTPRHRATAALGPRCAASVIVVTFGDLPLVRMAVESILANTQFARFEIIVVDNGSSPETIAYLQAVTDEFARMRLVLNSENEGFPAAVNRGLLLATGRVLVVLNDDVIVTSDWLVSLMRHLDDPEVGLVGPVTNAAPNEARVPTTYETYGELLAFAAERRDRLGGQATEIGVATMFCVAMRRDVYERVGPLDEGFGIGQFEDDDYAMRVRDAGYRVLCAEDVFVHHFGEASFGRLAPSGEYAEQLDHNRRRFEAKWGIEWTPHERRPSPQYEQCKAGIRQFAREHELTWADVLVVSNGDADLLDLDGATARHFPQGPDGQYTGHHPADGDDAVHQLETLRNRGARYVLLPRTSLWWLEHYAALRAHLETNATEIAGSDECRVFELLPRTLDARAPSSVGTRGN